MEENGNRPRDYESWPEVIQDRKGPDRKREKKAIPSQLAATDRGGVGGPVCIQPREDNVRSRRNSLTKRSGMKDEQATQDPEDRGNDNIQDVVLDLAYLFRHFYSSINLSGRMHSTDSTQPIRTLVVAQWVSHIAACGLDWWPYCLAA